MRVQPSDLSSAEGTWKPTNLRCALVRSGRRSLSERVVLLATFAGLFVGLCAGCTSAKGSASRTGSFLSTTTTSSTSPGRSGPSPSMAPGSSVPGYLVGPISFLSASQGYGLYEFDTTEGSSAQQLVVSQDGGVTWQVKTDTTLPAWASTLDFLDAETGYAWDRRGSTPLRR